MEEIFKKDPEIASLIKKDLERQKNSLDLIASENAPSLAVLQSEGSIMTTKYAEGYPGDRYYGGCEFVDEVEKLAIQRAKQIFGAEHVNVQPHSGTQANMAIYFAVLKPKDKILGMDIKHGGHLSHGSPANFSGRYYQCFFYGVDKETEILNYDEILKIAREVKPQLIICGASCYPRTIDFSRFREIADDVGAFLMADVAHIIGLIAADLHPSPIPYAHFVTATTHKTIRGPRGGIIFCKKEFATIIDRAVFPGIQGGPSMHTIAAKAVALGEAQSEDFKSYQKQITSNAQALAEAFHNNGFRIITGGTDNHLVFVDLRPKEVTGDIAEKFLEAAGIIVNKENIPFDRRSSKITSGIRLGTPSLTTRGMKEDEMVVIGNLIERVIDNINNEKEIAEVKKEVLKLCQQFPLYPEL